MSTRFDDEYYRRLDERGPAFGVELCARMLQDVVAMLNLQVQRECPDLSERERRIETARRLYFGDEATQRLLDLAAKATTTAE